MRLKAQVQLKRTVKKVVSEYHIDGENLPIDVDTSVERSTLKKEWNWRAWYVHQNDAQDQTSGFWRKTLLSHRSQRGSLIPNPFSWSRSGSVSGTCKSEKEANIQAAYAMVLLKESIQPILVLNVYHELSELESRP